MSERTDTERLDWLEANARATGEDRRTMTAREADGRFLLWHGSRAGFSDHDGLREAIDAAMDATTDPEAEEAGS